MVAIWRSAEVEAVLGGRLDRGVLTESDLTRLIVDGVAETEQIEFKGRRYAKASEAKDGWRVEQEFAKDVASLANHRGGLLVIGLAERNGVADALVPIEGTTFDQEHRRLAAALTNYTAPLCPVDMIEISVTGGFALGVVVPPSRRSPHAVVTADRHDGRRPLRYPVRHGTTTRWMTESEVADRYVRRYRDGQDDVEHLATVVDQGVAALSRSDDLWFYVAATPEVGSISRLNRQAVHAARDWVENQAVQSLFGEDLFYGLRANAGPRRAVLGRRSQQNDPLMAPVDVYLELHCDGSAFAAMSVVGFATAPPRKGDADRAVDLESLAAYAVPLVDLAGRWVAHQATVPGESQTRAGLIDASGVEGRFAMTVAVQTTDAFGQFRQVSDTRQIQDVAPRETTVRDLAAPFTVRDSVETSSTLLDGILQWFGLADCPFCTRTGKSPPEPGGTTYRPVCDGGPRITVFRRRDPRRPPL